RPGEPASAGVAADLPAALRDYGAVGNRDGRGRRRESGETEVQQLESEATAAGRPANHRRAGSAGVRDPARAGIRTRRPWPRLDRLDAEPAGSRGRRNRDRRTLAARAADPAGGGNEATRGTQGRWEVESPTARGSGWVGTLPTRPAAVCLNRPAPGTVSQCPAR